MVLRVLAIGDVVGEEGIAFLTQHLRALKQLRDIHFIVVNGENASGLGIHPRQADAIFDAGADVITLGNHTWNRLQIVDYMSKCEYILRPANYTGLAPGRGWQVYSGPNGLRIAVINLIGRTGMDANFDNPFFTADAILTEVDADLILVDFHAEATSEKGAMAWYLDGRVHALWGTHTHVPTADCRVMPRGTGFVSDLGMTGPSDSVLGIRPQQAINRFLGGLPARFESAEGGRKLESVLFTLDTASGLCTAVERLDIHD